MVFHLNPKKHLNQEALEGSAGLSASGGIDSDDSWDDEVEEMDFSSQETTEEELEPSLEVSAEDIYDQENSLRYCRNRCEV